MNDFISTVLDRMDSAGANFSERAYGVVGSEIMPLLKLALVLYVIMYGVQLVMGTSRISVQELIGRTARMMIILSLVSEWSNFDSLFYGWMNDVPENVGRSILSVSGTGISEPTTGLGQIWKSANVAAASYAQQSGYFAVLPSLFGFGVMIVAGLFIAVALAILILAKVMLWLLIGTAPIFIGCMLFEPTRGFGTAWFQQVLLYALIPLFVYVVAAFLVVAINPELASLEAAANSSSLQLSDAAAFVLLCFAGAFVLLNIQSLAQGIAGGLALNVGSFGRGALGLPAMAASWALGGKSNNDKKPTDKKGGTITRTEDERQAAFQEQVISNQAAR